MVNIPITKKTGFIRAGRSRDIIGNALTELLLSNELKQGESIIIGHREYAKMKGENLDEVILGGKYQKNNPEYREVRGVNKKFGYPKGKGFRSVSVIINDEQTAKEVGLSVGDFAFQITKFS